MAHVRLRRLPVLPAAALGLLLAAGGCASTRFGSELPDQPRPRALGGAGPVTLHLPADAAFNIALPSSTRRPGLGGTASADAEAHADGRAAASAAVSESGQAQGLFQLGHALANDGERQMDCDLEVRFRYRFEVGQEPALNLPDAEVGLRLYARDSRGRLLRDLVLVEHTTEHGAALREADEHSRFTLTLSPGQTVNVFLAGQVRVEIEHGRSASGSLDVSGLTIDVTTRPAPAAGAAGHEPA